MLMKTSTSQINEEKNLYTLFALSYFGTLIYDPLSDKDVK